MLHLTASCFTGMDIFVDEEFDGGRPAATYPSAASWSHLASFDDARKEDVQVPAKWAGEILNLCHFR